MQDDEAARPQAARAAFRKIAGVLLVGARERRVTL